MRENKKKMMQNKTKVRFKQAQASKNIEPAPNYIFFSAQIKSERKSKKIKLI